MNKSQLNQILAKRLNLNSSSSQKILNTVLETIKETLASRQQVSISRFGTFYLYKTKSRTIPNPRNPYHKIITLGQFTPKFKPSLFIKEKVKNLNIAKVSKQNKTALIDEKILNISRKGAKFPYISLKNRIIPKDILSKIPAHIAKNYQIVPVEEKEGKLVVAMVNPEDIEAREFVKKKTGMELIICLTSASELQTVLEQYSGLAQEVKELLKTVTTTPEEETKQEESLKEVPIEIEAPVARLVNSLLHRAIQTRASDIHIEPQEKEVAVRYRIDGILQKIVSIPKEMEASIIARIKIMSNLKTDENRIPQDGRFSLKMNKSEVDFRVSTLPTVYGEKVVMRVLDKSRGILTLQDLGLTPSSFQILNENIHKSHGMILVTGPTGCGKTTTLYAVIDEIYDVGINIVTLEDPVEYRIPGVNQSQVNPNVNYNFANGLRSIVRQDPDVIMIGEIRDQETVAMAIHAALTGHIVLSTLHTNDAAGAIPRLIDMGAEPFLVASSLNLVIAQRLCRKICENCKTPYSLPSPVRAEIEREIRLMPPQEKKEILKRRYSFYKGKGCNACNQTGYKGRVGIFELLPVTEEIKQLTIKKAAASVIAQTATSQGMLTLKQDGIKKVLQGITTIEEVWRTTKE